MGDVVQQIKVDLDRVPSLDLNRVWRVILVIKLMMVANLWTLQ